MDEQFRGKHFLGGEDDAVFALDSQNCSWLNLNTRRCPLPFERIPLGTVGRRSRMSSQFYRTLFNTNYHTSTHFYILLLLNKHERINHSI